MAELNDKEMVKKLKSTVKAPSYLLDEIAQTLDVSFDLMTSEQVRKGMFEECGIEHFEIALEELSQTYTLTMGDLVEILRLMKSNA